MRIHFVCMGNTYRSRLAEAYLRSLHLPDIEVTSSGVQAARNFNGPISPYTQLLLNEHKLNRYAKHRWTQTTQALLDSSDIAICMNRQVYNEAAASYKMPARTYVWDIPDITHVLPSYKRLMARHEVPLIAEHTFRKIVGHVDELAAYLMRPKHAEQIDVFDETGEPLGYHSDIDDIHQKGLWFQGIHVVLYTPDRKVVLQKRSPRIIYNPGLWDMSAGGIVPGGEPPIQAAVRELREELGISLRQEDLKELFTWRYNYFVSHFGFHNKCFIHTYIAEIDDKQTFHLQKSEVADAKFVDLRTARELIINGHNALGEMTHYKAFNLRLLRAVEHALRSRT